MIKIGIRASLERGFGYEVEGFQQGLMGVTRRQAQCEK